MAEKRTAEPFVWLMFSSGGVVAALVLPVLLFLFGVAMPLGWIPAPSHGELLSLLRNPLVRIGLIGVCALSLVHGAHRLRFTVQDGLRLQRYEPVIATACYGAALAGTAWAVYLMLAVL